MIYIRDLCDRAKSMSGLVLFFKIISYIGYYYFVLFYLLNFFSEEHCFEYFDRLIFQA